MLWTGFALVHLVQRFVLSFGWLPSLTELLDRVEEVAAACTMIVFMVSSFFSFAWGAFRKTQREVADDL